MYTTVGFILAQAYGLQSINIFENGITSINLSKRQDLINARASRTTHPKTLSLLESVYTIISGQDFTIQHPLLYNTKTEVVEIINRYGRSNLIGASVTCTKTFQKFENRTGASHCGYCTQCVDRQFAMYAAKLEDKDAVYNFDLASESFPKPDARTHVIDYIGHSQEFNSLSFDAFCFDYLDEIADLTFRLESNSDREIEEVEAIHNLFERHARSVNNAYLRMASKFDLLNRKRIPDSIYEIVGNRTHLREKADLLAESISIMLTAAIPVAYAHKKPEREHELNDQINALLLKDRPTYSREYPAVKFSFSTTIPDHSFAHTDEDLFVEAKYLRNKMSPSQITDELGADLIKYPQNAYKLFVIYDPERRIPSDEVFKGDFEKFSKCSICIVR